jgi:TonB family protein
MPDLCALSVSKVKRALSRAKRNSSIWDTTSFGIGATCGSETKVFRLPLTDLIDMNRLKRASPDVAALYDLYGQIVRETFQDKSFYKNSAEVDREFQVVGSTFIPELLSGKYDKALSAGYLSATSLKPFLADYHGIRHDADNIEAWVEVDSSIQENLTRYADPIYPPLAITARIVGEVQLDLDVDELGQVKNSVITGHPLLKESAKVAVDQWKFRPTQSEKIRGTLRYRLDGRCE